MFLNEIRGNGFWDIGGILVVEFKIVNCVIC